MRVAASLLALVACGTPELRERELPSCGQWAGGHWDRRFDLAGAYGTKPRVRAIAKLQDGSIVVGGAFDGINRVAARNIARWDGVTWSPIGGDAVDTVVSMAVADDGALWIVTNGGAAFHVLRWTGATWVEVGSTTSSVGGVTAIEGGVIVWGGFSTFANVTARGLAIYRAGTWTNGPLDNSRITDVVREGSEFCIAGDLRGPSLTWEGLACWADDTWTTVGDRLPPIERVAHAPDGQWFASQLWIPPLVDVVAGDSSNLLVTLDPTAASPAWSDVDGGVHVKGAWSDYGIRDLAFDGDDLIVAGYFDRVGVNLEVTHAARYHPGVGWSALVSGVAIDDGVDAVLLDGDQTYIGGAFHGTTQGVPSAAIALIGSGGAVSALPASAAGIAFTGGVTGLADSDDGVLIAGRLAIDGLHPLARFDGELHGVPDVPIGVRAGIDITVAALPDGELVIRDAEASRGAMHRTVDGEWQDVTHEIVPPFAVDADGAVYYSLNEDADAFIMRSTRSGSERVTIMPGHPARGLAIHAGALYALGRLDEARVVLRYAEDNWEVIGAFDGTTMALTASPALGLVLYTPTEIRAWNGHDWRVLVQGDVHGVGACSDGVAAGVNGELVFIDSSGTTVLSSRDQPGTWQILPTTRGIYTAVGDTNSALLDNTAFARFATGDDTGW